MEYLKHKHSVPYECWGATVISRDCKLRHFFLTKILFCVYEYFTCLNVCALHVCSALGGEIPELELKTVVSLHVGAGN